VSGAGHYEVLGVARDADLATLRQAYLALARRHHPDRPGGDTERMRAVNQAWSVLSDPARREQYDLAQREPPTTARPAPGWPSQDRPSRDRYGRDPRYDPTDDLSDEELRSDHILFDRVFAHEAADLRADLRDHQPLGRTVVLPRWAALLPPGAFAAAVACFCFGLVLNITAIVAFSFALLIASIVLFLVAPFVALLSSRQDVDGR
jgi:hypothetical protein